MKNKEFEKIAFMKLGSYSLEEYAELILPRARELTYLREYFKARKPLDDEETQKLRHLSYLTSYFNELVTKYIFMNHGYRGYEEYKNHYWDKFKERCPPCIICEGWDSWESFCRWHREKYPDYKWHPSYDD